MMVLRRRQRALRRLSLESSKVTTQAPTQEAEAEARCIARVRLWPRLTPSWPRGLFGSL